MNWFKTAKKSLSFLSLFLLLASLLVVIVPPNASAKQSTETTNEVGTQVNQSSAVSYSTHQIEEDDVASVDSEVYQDQTTEASVIDNPEPALEVSEQRVDSFESLSIGNKDGFSIKNKNGPYKASFADKAGDKFLNFAYSDAEISLVPVGYSSVKGEVNNDKITYKKIYPETDLQYQLESSSLKETIVVKKYTGKSTYDFNMTVANALYQKNDNGEIVFFSPLNGKGLFYLDKPFAVDSAGNRCDAASLDIIGDGTLRLSVDSAWLKNAVYPVMIDPTINLFDPTFTRAYVANKLDFSQVADNVPRYEIAKFGKGIMVEEPTRNIIDNVSCTHEATYLGWFGIGGVLSQSTSQYLDGCKSMQFVTSTAGDNYAFRFNTLPSSQRTIYSTVSPNTTYTYSTYVNIPSSLTDGSTYLKVVEYTTAEAIVREQSMPTGKSVTSGWEREVLTFTTSATTAKVLLYICQSGIGTSYSDAFQLEQKPYATTWVYTGYAYGRTAETLAIPTNYTFNKNNWSVEMVYKNTCPTLPTNNMFLWNVYIDANNYQSLYVKPTGALCYAGKYGGTYFLIESSAGYVVPGTDYQIMIAFDGTKARLCCDGSQIGADTIAGVLVGTLPTNMYIGSFKDGTVQADGIIDDIRISNRARTLSEHLALFQCNKILPIDNSTTCKLEFEGNLHAAPTINSTANATFARNSVAYSPEAQTTEFAVNQPRYRTGKILKGIVVEEATANYCVLSDFEDLSLVTELSGSYASTHDANAAKHGHYSCKITAGTSNAYGGASTGYAMPVSPGLTYTFSVYAVGVLGGEKIEVIPYKTDLSQAIASGAKATLTTGWTRLANTFTIPSGCTSIVVLIRKDNISASQKWWIDCMQLEQKAYETCWTNSSRAAETLTIPTANVLNKGKFTVEMVYKPTSNPAHTGFLWMTQADSANYYAIYQDASGHLTFRICSGNVSVNLADTTSMVADTTYTIMATVDGTHMRLYKNGVQIGSDTDYTEIIGILAGNMYLGCNISMSAWADGVYDDLRFSNCARTLAEHQAAYLSNQPLILDKNTTCKLNFDSSMPILVKEEVLQFNYYKYNSSNTLNFIVSADEANNTVKQYNFVYDANGNMTNRSAT